MTTSARIRAVSGIHNPKHPHHRRGKPIAPELSQNTPSNSDSDSDDGKVLDDTFEELFYDKG